MSYNKQGIEWQVCSLEYAKKLKELGVPQESMFWWVECQLPTPKKTYVKFAPKGAMNGYTSAYTVAELGEMLPAQFKVQEYSGFKEENLANLTINKHGKWEVVSAYKNPTISTEIG